MNYRSKVIYILLALLIIIGSAYFLFFNETNITQQIIETEKDPKGKSVLTEEKATFKIAQASEVWPKILEATVDPPKVAVGDTQYMNVTAQSPDGIASVKAIIGTDNGTTTIELTKTGENAQYIPKIQVDGDKVVGVYSDEELEQLAKEMEEGIIPKAVAQQPEVEVWEGEWVVQDTHTAWYTTTFIAVDNEGQKTTYSVDWLDPECGIPVKIGGTHTLSSNCSPSTLTGAAKWGSSGGSLDLGSYSLTLSNPFIVEGSLSLGTGSLSLGTGYLDLSSSLYVNDDDGDEYADENNLTQYDSNASGRTLQSQLNHSQWDNADCHDGDSDVSPGQNNYFNVPYNTNNYDYNCDGVVNFEKPLYDFGTCYRIHNSEQSSSGSMEYPFYDSATNEEYGFICDATLGSTGNYYCVVRQNIHGQFEMAYGICSDHGSYFDKSPDSFRDAYRI